MPLDDLGDGLLRGLGRFLVNLVVEVLFETLIRGTGYGVCRIFSRRVDPDGFTAGAVGLLIWIGVGGAIYVMFFSSSGGTQA